MKLVDDDEYILLIESNPGTADVIRSSLAVARDGPFTVAWMNNLQEGLVQLRKGRIKTILLNLQLSDSQGMDTFNKLYAIDSQIPILILCDLDNEDLAKLAIQNGAQDYLLTDLPHDYSFSRAIRNVIERKRAEDALFSEMERAQVTLSSIGDAVISTDSAGNVSYLNVVAERMTGWSQREAKGRLFTDVFRIIDSFSRETLPNPMALAMLERKSVTLPKNTLLIRRDGVEAFIEDTAAPIRDRRGRISGAVIVFHDVSETHSLMLKMSHLAQHDFLTDLPNRLLLNDRLAQSISISRRNRKQLALLFIDLDHFKTINDSLGHLIGDKLLQSVAQRLEICVRDSDTVSRQGGDEFVVLLPDIEHAKSAGCTSAKIIALLSEKHCIAEHDLNITLSIGISIFPDDGEDADTLLKNADAAMYHAKEYGRNNFQYFKKEMNERAVERQSLESNMRQAFARHEFVLHYQPKINLKTGSITGAEALIRWIHPVRGMLYPEQFVSIAEDSGLIVPLGQWILREACQQAKNWQLAGDRPTLIAVNVSAVEFRRDDFLEDVKRALRETGLAAHYLEIELTESVLLHDVDSTMVVLHELKAMGVRLAIDDFGTGNSSLSYLRKFPIDTLKIDQSFLRDLTTVSGDATIVSAVIGMGNSLKLRVIAEGIETKEQLAFLQTEHCEEGQGFYFCPPLDAESFALLRSSSSRDYVVN